MRAVLQRVAQARVAVGERSIGQIGAGLLILLGVGKDDSEANADALADKIKHLRIFEDEQGKMNRSVGDVGGECSLSRNLLCTAIAARATGHHSPTRHRRPRPNGYIYISLNGCATAV